MRKNKYKLSLLIALLCSTICFGQYRFEKGYFIDNDGQRTECLLRNVGWPYNPSFFEYKLADNEPVSRKESKDVKEFGIPGTIRFVSARVNIDRSTDAPDDNSMSNTFEPEWKEEQLFLKVLEEGDVSLLVYEENGFTRFFYQVKSSPIQQLIHKRYRQPGETYHSYNRNYLNQLLVHVNCKKLPIERLENIGYTAFALRKWFRQHNLCIDPSAPKPKTERKKWFSPKIGAGLSFVSYKSGKSSFAPEAEIDYGQKTALTIAAELEFLLRFTNYKWSVIIESSTLSYKASGANLSGIKNTIDYNTVNVLAGIRSYYFIGDKWKALVEGGFVKDLKQDNLGVALGAGVRHGKFMAELRYFHQRNILGGYFDRTEGSKFSNMSAVAKFELF